jgi:hypothetical protein
MVVTRQLTVMRYFATSSALFVELLSKVMILEMALCCTIITENPSAMVPLRRPVPAAICISPAPQIPDASFKLGLVRGEVKV